VYSDIDIGVTWHFVIREKEMPGAENSCLLDACSVNQDHAILIFQCTIEARR